MPFFTTRWIIIEKGRDNVHVAIRSEILNTLYNTEILDVFGRVQILIFFL